MKVLFVTTAYKRFDGDVITPWLVELILRLKKKGVEVVVFTSSYKGLRNQIIDGVRIERFRYFLKKFEDLTHEETVVDRLKRSPIYLLLIITYLIAGTLKMIKLVKREHFDIIHIHWPFPHIVFGLFGRYAGRARLFSTFYGVEIRWIKKKFPFLVPLFSLAINKSDVITAISSHTAGELSTVAKTKIEIIPFSTPITERSGKTTDAKQIIFVGRLVERKGVKYLIEAFARIKDEVKHNLVIIGEGPERKALEEQVKVLHLEKRVTFTGRISDRELHRSYEKCSFLVLPAVYDKKGDIEGLGVVLIEAMSYRKPVIASRAGGITDIVEDGKNGFLVPPGDAAKLAGAMKTLANDDKLRSEMGGNAKKSIDEKFNWDRIVDRLIELYEKNHIRRRYE